MKLYLYNGRCNQAGENIRKVREEMGLSQEQLGDHAKIHQQDRNWPARDPRL